MSEFVAICPRDDGHSQQASDWYAELLNRLQSSHTQRAYVDDWSPADATNILAALQEPNLSLVLYFGHGTDEEWLTNNRVTVDKSNVGAAAGKAVISVACFTGRNLGPDAVTQGIEAWLGFTIKVPIIAPHKGRDPIGEAIVAGLATLSASGAISDARAAVEAEVRNLAIEFDDGGQFDSHPGAPVGYYASIALANNVSLAGKSAFVPL